MFAQIMCTIDESVKSEILGVNCKCAREALSSKS